MKKFGIGLLVVAIALCMAPMAFGQVAEVNSGFYPPPAPTLSNQGAEAQAFANGEASWSQDFAKQEIDQTSITKTTKETNTCEASGYGSIYLHAAKPESSALAFGKIETTQTSINSCDFTVAKIDAKVESLSGNAALSGNAGSSVLLSEATTASAAASASNIQNLNLGSSVNLCNGTATQTYSGSNSAVTSVTAPPPTIH